MAEYVSNASQTVALNGDVLFSDTAVKACPCVRHRDGSGIFSLRGGHTYTLMFSGNVTGATGGVTVALAFALSGEEVAGTRMDSTPSAANQLNNVSSFVNLDVPCGCCYTVAIKNVGTTALTVANANLVIRRED